MSAENGRDRSGKVIAFWMGWDEIDALADKAEQTGRTRNAEGRQAVRAWTGLPVADGE